MRFFIRYAADMKDAMLISVISVSDIYAKISVNEIKIGTLNAPLFFHLKIMVMNDSQGELLTTITQILMVGTACTA